MCHYDFANIPRISHIFRNSPSRSERHTMKKTLSRDKVFFMVRVAGLEPASVSTGT